jgi:murein DD-endopeptidase MepM/ murein hydrolase activator NlpD
MVDAVNASDYAGIQRDFGKVMLDAFPLDKSTPFFKSLSAQYGKIERLDPARLVPPNQAIFPAHFEHGILDIKIVLDDQDKIIGLWFLPYTPDIPLIDKNTTELSLPFGGRWFVYWGGDTQELNQHHNTQNQRFAFDFVVVNEEGKTHNGDGKVNEDYYAFGKEVLAPADGIVTEVINGVTDNMPGSMNPYSALGNAVIIQHSEHEVSVLAHFKLGSINVKVGDSVKRGQVIGLCGNSGNSSEPHVHYHLQNTPVIQDGTGIKCYFLKLGVMKNDSTETKENYSPVKGEIVWQE